MKKFNLDEIFEELLNSDVDEDCSSLPVRGKSPFGDSWPCGIWSWDEQTKRVIVGESRDNFEIVSYDEAIKIYN